MKATLTDSGSSLEKERRAWVGWPFTSLMPKISEEGNDVEILTAMLGEVEGVSTSSSAYSRSQLAARWLLAKKRTSCAKVPMNRSASNAIVITELYPMMPKGEKQITLYLQLAVPKIEKEIVQLSQIHFP